MLHYFSAVEGKLCLVIATTALGLGVDCQDIARVIHWGPPPSTVEEYIQEIGRSGRNGELAIGVLGSITSAMKYYIQNNSVCQHELLFRNFIMYSDSVGIPATGCKCCDICKTHVII